MGSIECEKEIGEWEVQTRSLKTELQAPLGRSTYAHSHSLSGLVILQRFPNNSSVISEEINSKGSSTRLIYDYY